MIEEDVKRVVRGPADLEEQIHQLKKQVEFFAVLNIVPSTPDTKEAGSPPSRARGATTQ